MAVWEVLLGTVQDMLQSEEIQCDHGLMRKWSKDDHKDQVDGGKM